MTRELLGRVSKASQELFGQNAGLRALRMFETKTEELLRPDQELLGREEPVPKSSRGRTENWIDSSSDCIGIQCQTENHESTA